MKAFSNGKNPKILNITILIFFFFYSGARIYIGYCRSFDGVLSNERVSYGHMVAFFFMAIADLICTIGILYYIKTFNNEDYIKDNNNIDHYIKRSSYIILVCVDIVSILLAIFNGLSVRYNELIPESFTKPFLNLKISFILILACDALLFKYSVYSSSARASSNYLYGGDTYCNKSTTKSGNYGMESIHINNNSNNNLISSKKYRKEKMNSSRLKNEKAKYEKLVDILESIGYSFKQHQQNTEWKLEEKASFLGTLEWAFSIPSTKNFMNWLVDTLEIGFSENQPSGNLDVFPNKLGVLTDLEYKAFEEINKNNTISLEELPEIEDDNSESLEDLSKDIDSLIEEFDELEEDFDLLERQYTHMNETLNNQKIELQKIKISNSLLEKEANENNIKTNNLIVIMDSVIREGISSSKELITNNEISNLEGLTTNQNYIYQCLSDFSKYISQENIYDKMLNDYNDMFILPFTEIDKNKSNNEKQLDINNEEIKYEMKRLSSVYIDSQKSYFNALMEYKKIRKSKKNIIRI